jgi:glutathione synthase/RimK-type ligase-like ATP-grasp enzyme
VILLWGISDDGPLMAVHEALQRQRAPAFFLDQRQVLSTEIELFIDKTVEGLIRLGDVTCDLAALRAVYVRCYDSRRVPEIERTGEGSAAWRHAQSVDETLRSLLEVTPALVVNPMSAMASNNSKPYQLSLIRSLGFEVPETLITTDSSAAQDFWERHGAVVYKSISGVRSIVSRLTEEHLNRLPDLRWCPTQFQKYVCGRDYRVHIVGDEAFACEIATDADDYRYAARRGRDVELRPYDLPADCADKCRKLAAALNLVVTGLDLRRTPEGQWYCFEVNPSPAFTYYAAATDQPIADAVARLLTRQMDDQVEC